MITATGKRKSAIARVRLSFGNGEVVVNGKRMEEYFPREVLCIRVNAAFEAAGVEGRYNVNAKVHGGGIAGQADALRHGISRALQTSDETLRAPLKKKGFLTRDARKKERKKYGQKGARARFQFSKR
ncbi:30S ribosomal protein S9 [Myxococcota bacterium]|nr:30S ribosomal protein S9 [Myxococcota bacterium]